MGATPARSLTTRRSRPHAYLLLSRVSNLPTIWSNVLAGWTVASGRGVDGWSGTPTAIAAAVSLIYTGGMVLNDAFDAAFDAAHRSERPVPAGDVSRTEAFGLGFLLLALGVAWLAAVSVNAFAWGIVLSAAVVAYDYHHKGFRFGPLVMGLCRGLVYCVAASAVAALSTPVIVAAVVLTLYTASLTLVAKRAGPRAGVVVPVMIAGISLVDAVVIVASGGGWLALVGAVCFALTLAMQRIVPGT